MTPGTQDELRRLARWARRLGEQEVLVLGCADARLPGDGDAEVSWSGCLSTLGVDDLAVLAAAAPSLTIVLGACGAGPAAAGSRQDQDPVADLEELLGALRLGHRVRVRRQARAGTSRGAEGGTPDLPLRRRDLFGWLRGPEQHHPGASGRAPGRSERREVERGERHGEARGQVRLVAALRELVRQEHGPGDAPETEPSRPPRSSPVPSPAPPGTGGPGALSLSARGCTACRTCVLACPTEALALRTFQDGRRATLELVPEACIGCRRCLALCPVEALRDEGRPGWAELVGTPSPTELETVALRSCARCRTAFAGEGELCQVCSLRAGDPFGSWLPPGYVAPRVYAPPPGEDG